MASSSQGGRFAENRAPSGGGAGAANGGALYHLGCGPQRLEGFVNVDVRPTEAADIVTDLNTLDGLPQGAAEGFFSHAFFEHLYRDSRVPHLKAVLERGGFACYLGLPDFRRIAELYLSSARGIEGPVFDLHEVYRYTHGDPEMGGIEWLPQLHKSLFDVPGLDHLLRDAGFPSYVIFRYVFPGDPAELDLSLGFYATAAQRQPSELKAAAEAFLRQFDGRFLLADTVSFDATRSRGDSVARVLAAGPTLAGRRLAYRAACRLAQLS
jgi:predicted SAM-dependent methyltransferase